MRLAGSCNCAPVVQPSVSTLGSRRTMALRCREGQVWTEWFAGMVIARGACSSRTGSKGVEWADTKSASAAVGGSRSQAPVCPFWE